MAVRDESFLSSCFELLCLCAELKGRRRILPLCAGIEAVNFQRVDLFLACVLKVALNIFQPFVATGAPAHVTFLCEMEHPSTKIVKTNRDAWSHRLSCDCYRCSERLGPCNGPAFSVTDASLEGWRSVQRQNLCKSGRYVRAYFEGSVVSRQP